MIISISRIKFEELINAITHGLGTLFAIIGSIIIIKTAYKYEEIWHLISCIIYSISLISLFLASTLYHSFNNEKLKYIFKILDHSAIYILIAGTYTPFTLIPLHGIIGLLILYMIWGLAIIGIIFKIFFIKKYKIISMICYITMGWFFVFLLKPLLIILPMNGIFLLLIGGFFYTIGSIFYLTQKLPYNHAIWHLFVLAGSTLHFFSIFRYVLPLSIK